MSITTNQGERLTAMKNPPHPGGIVLRQCIEPLGLTITGAAEALGVARNTLSELVNGKRGISPEMAVRIFKVFGGAEEAGLCNRHSLTLHMRNVTDSSSSALSLCNHELHPVGAHQPRSGGLELPDDRPPDSSGEM